MVAGSRGVLEVIGRHRIETADTAILGSRQPFHAAEPLPFAEAAVFLNKCTESTRRLARQALRNAIEEARNQGYQTGGCGIILGSGRALPPLEAILASHALIHTAEGEFYRNALIEAGEHCGLAVIGTRERELWERAAAQLLLPLKELERALAEAGRKMGPPWTQDQKYAALAGWIALAHHPSAR